MKVVLSFVLGLLLMVGGLAQTSQTPRDQKTGQSGMTGQKSPHPSMMGQKSGQSGMSTSCQEMMQHHEKLMSDMQQMDTQLQAKVSAMNSATGDKKIQAIADAVNELATQRHQMFARMEEMHSGMMAHMAEHMQSGGAQSMANCPMMKQMSQAGMHPPQGTPTKPVTGKSKTE